MEDAATAEIARVQLWQWAHHGAKLQGGETVTPALIDAVIREVAPGIRKVVPGAKEEHVQISADYLRGQVRKQWPSEFLTSDLMGHLEAADGVGAQSAQTWQRASL